MKKRLTLLITAILMMFILVGCGSEIQYYVIPGETEATHHLQIYVSDNDLSTLQSQSIPCLVNKSELGLPAEYALPENWTVEAYLDILINHLPGFNRFFTDYTTQYTGGFMLYQFSATVANDPSSSKTVVGDPEKSLFYYKWTIEYENPFNAFIKEYNDKENQYSPVSVFKNGLKNAYGATIFPAFEQAFPVFSLIYPYDVDLSYYCVTPNRYFTGEPYEEFDGYKYYLFSTTLDQENGTIKYELRRANTLGWNLLTITVGLLVVGSLILVCRVKGKGVKDC